MRWANSASRRLWVTITTVVPTLLSSERMFITSMPFFESRLPVGSSARISPGFDTTAQQVGLRFKPSVGSLLHVDEAHQTLFVFSLSQPVGDGVGVQLAFHLCYLFVKALAVDHDLLHACLQLVEGVVVVELCL